MQDSKVSSRASATQLIAGPIISSPIKQTIPSIQQFVSAEDMPFNGGLPSQVSRNLLTKPQNSQTLYAKASQPLNPSTAQQLNSSTPQHLNASVCIQSTYPVGQCNAFCRERYCQNLNKHSGRL